MQPYSIVVSLHVITAVLGLGPLAALAVLTRPAADPFPSHRAATLLRIVGWSLGVMLVTGVTAIAFTHGALGHAGWVRVSVGLLVLLGILQGLARRKVKRARDANLPAQGLTPLLWSMCAIVATITYLMEAKPW